MAAIAASGKVELSMAHKIRVACLGTGDLLPRAVDALLKGDVIPPENIFLSRKDGPQIERFAASGCRMLDDDMNAIVNGELVLVIACACEMPAVLAPVCGCTSGRYLIAVSDHVTVEEIESRVAKGTQIMAVSTHLDAQGHLCGQAVYSKGFAVYLKQPCEDIVRSLLYDLTA